MKWRKTAVLLLCTMLLACCLPLCAVNVSADQSYKNQLDYKISMYGEVMITGAGEKMPAHLKIPSQINGYPVTIIDQMAFHGCEELVSVTLPDTIEVIWDWGFRDCDNLTSVFLGKGLSTIGEHAFMDCNKLPAFTVDKDNPYFCAVDGVLFTKDMSTLWQYPSGKQGSSYTVPDGVKTIGPSSFYCCKQLTSLTIPDGVTTIGRGAFVGCKGLTSVVLPDGMQVLKEHAFGECTNLEELVLPDSITQLDNHIITMDDKVQQINIPAGLRKIGRSTFSGSGLVSATIPEGVTLIEEYAFSNCEYLTSVTIPKSVTHIEKDVFYRDMALTDVYYGGTEEEWNAIQIDGLKSDWDNIAIHFQEEEEPPVTPPVEKKEKSFPWLWVVLGIGVVLIAVVAVKNKKASD